MQTVSAAFQNAAEAKNRVLKHSVKVAWEKTFDDTITFATIDTSTIDGPDIVQGELTVITKPDLYEYTDESSHVTQLEATREFSEPNGSVVYGFGSAIFGNADDRYFADSDSPIKDYILPKRPIKMLMGLVVDGVEKTVPIMYGISKAPNVTKQNAVFPIFDYLSIIQNYELNSDQIYLNQSTDELIALILDEIGFDVTQYDLDQGLNRIKVAVFSKGSKAGAVIQKLCEAEEGFFFQDEMGLLRFTNRIAYKQSPLNAPVVTIDRSMILEYTELPSTKIINSVRVTARPREVQDTTEIWTNGSSIQINPGETIDDIWADLDDPASSIEDVNSSVGTDDDLDIIVNSDPNGAGSSMNGDINVTLTKFAQAAKIQLENMGSNVAYVTKLRLRGNPALITSQIEVTANDADSQEIYDEEVFEIRNDFIDNPEFAKYIARGIVQKYAIPKKRKKVKIRALPYLQLKDMVTLDLDGVETDYRIMKIELTMLPGSFNQVLYLREVTDDESDQAAIIDVSLIDGTDVIV